jgi:hydrogenase maturation factor
VTGTRAVARRGGGEVVLSLLTVDEPVSAGDWVLAHSGFVLERLSPAAAADALSLRQAPVPEPAAPHSPVTTTTEEPP